MEAPPVVEEWKPVPANTYFSKYEASSLGRIRNISTGRIVPGHIDKKTNYVTSSLSGDNDTVSKTQKHHELIAAAFIPGKGNVGHINGVAFDNRSVNLFRCNTNNKIHGRYADGIHNGEALRIGQYNAQGNLLEEFNNVYAAIYSANVSLEELTRAIINSTQVNGFVWKYTNQNLPNEIWKLMELNHTKIAVSSHGRIRLDTLITYGALSMKRILHINIKGKLYSVDKLVCSAFKGPATGDERYVSHRDRINSSNHKDNLEWSEVPDSDYCDTTSNSKQPVTGRPIAKIDPKTNEIIEIFKTVTDAVESLRALLAKNSDNVIKVRHECIAAAARSAGSEGKCYIRYGFKWRYVDPRDYRIIIAPLGLEKEADRAIKDICEEFMNMPDETLVPIDLSVLDVTDAMMYGGLELPEDILDIPLFADDALTEFEKKNKDLPGEIWKSHPFEPISKYMISNMGRVKHIKLGVHDGYRPEGKYLYSSLCCDDGVVRIYRHNRLVAGTFLPPEPGKPIVDHINHNIIDNRVSNLRWVTYSENSFNTVLSTLARTNGRKIRSIHPKTGITKLYNSLAEATRFHTMGQCNSSHIGEAARGKRRLAFGHKWEYVFEDDLEGEIWIIYLLKDTHIQVSNKGRIKSLSDVMYKQKLNGNYLYVNVKDGIYRVHRIICEAFHGPPPTPEQDTVNHIDHDPENNDIDNLEWASTKEQNTHRNAPVNFHSTGKRVIQFDVESNEIIEIWPSLRYLCDQLDLSVDTIRNGLIGDGYIILDEYGLRYA